MKSFLLQRIDIFTKKKLWIIGLTVLIFLCVNTFIIISLKQTAGISQSTAKGSVHTIILQEDGFSPQKLTIQKGDTIIFKTELGEIFWPASNLHPSHTIYPEFDPLEPVEPNASWQFTFQKSGVWTYHDHLSPFYRGEITVQESSSSLPTTQNKSITRDGCQKLQLERAKLQCQEASIKNILSTEGVSGAFDLLGELFQADPTFANNCHDFSHRVGDEAYTVFAKNKEVAFSEKASYCGYGFYHGFMERLLSTGGTIEEARDFCDNAQQKLAAQTSDAGGACYHGIGHGIVEDTPDPSVWGRPQEIIKPGLELCKSMSLTADRLFRCDTGVFNALEVLMTQKKYDLSYTENDPFKICKEQKSEHQKACYTQFIVAVMNVTKNDFSRSAEYISSIPEDTYAIPALYSLVLELPRYTEYTHKKIASFCRELPERFQQTCIPSVAEGYFKYGPPQKEYEKAVAFCDASVFSDNEKKLCYSHILSRLRLWYTASKATSICNSVASRFQYNKCEYS